MAGSQIHASMLFLLLLLLFMAATINRIHASPSENTATAAALVSCLREKHVSNITLASSSGESYASLLKFSLQNLRYAAQNVRKPTLVIVPATTADVQAAVTCSVTHGYQIIVRSGGHSYEGRSSTSDIPRFILLDLMNLDRIHVHVQSRTAWAGAGATLGQLYAAVAAETDALAFPAGLCPTVGAGGHISGGGFSILSRKYGLAADNVLDAVVVSAAGKVLSGATIPRDMFWALRGGGGGSFGVVVAWKLRLVPVPKHVTFCNVSRTGEEAATPLTDRWQSVAPVMEQDMYVRAILAAADGNASVTFQAAYQGRLPDAVAKIRAAFPELELGTSDCKQGSWFDAQVFFSGTERSQIANRYYTGKTYFKNKSDFVKKEKPVPAKALAGAWKFLYEQPSAVAILTPMGGVFDSIPADRIAFPWRKGFSYFIQYVVTWNQTQNEHSANYLQWSRRFYDYMRDFVSSSPRAAYVNYIDLDLGVAWNGSISVQTARKLYGDKYFGANFDRLVQAKSSFDPANVFRHAQSIPVAH